MLFIRIISNTHAEHKKSIEFHQKYSKNCKEILFDVKRI